MNNSIARKTARASQKSPVGVKTLAVFLALTFGLS